MAVPDLMADYNEIADEVAFYLGYAESAIATEESALTLWDALQLRNVQKSIRRGYRRFLYPPPMTVAGSAEKRSHKWRFLRPITTLNAWATITPPEVSFVSYDSGADETTLHCNRECFRSDIPTESMVLWGNLGTYTVSQYIDAQTVVVSGDASGAGSGVAFYTPTYALSNTVTVTRASYASGAMTLTGELYGSTDPIFFAEMVGKEIVIPYLISGTVASYISGTSITVVTSDDATVAKRTITLTSDGDFNLPDNIGGIIGQLRFSSGEGFWAIPFTDEETITLLRQQSTATGIPCVAAKRPRSTDGSTSVGWTVCLHPLPSQYYALTYQGILVPYALSTTKTYPLGGAVHAQTIIAACIAEAENLVNGTHGDKWNDFLEHLAASIEADNTYNAPQMIGLSEDVVRIGNGGDYTVEAPS